ncbi:hypothetical protein [Sulfitobacter sp. R18_1]|uniref:hypothetical protein n=1 Tax=Sulfitobacter sp. R18_1 TaxID=2821104 RepID=UPI001ADAC1DB|nr:hypothetical protein [Sulfitobacter sp. R18_1]MBO9428553.1 hypothetical protein [Sulfitobacter sp. R18_1]
MAEKKPWHDMFISYGYLPSSVPQSDPPESREYGEIFEWVTGGLWPIERDESLIIDIWLGYADPWAINQKAQADQTEEAKPEARSGASPEPSVTKGPGRKRRFTQKSAETSNGMSP